MARGRHPARINTAPPGARDTDKYLRVWSGRDLHTDPLRFPRLTSPVLFGNDRPLEIDIGCGTGTLARKRARQFPEINFVGIDSSLKPLYYAVGDAARAGLKNTLFIRGNFVSMLPLFLPRTVTSLYYLLPNPPQNYHQERANACRREVLEQFHSALIPGGRFVFSTDSPAFFACMKHIMEYDLKHATVGFDAGSEGISTRYWRLWEEKGRAVHCFAVIKRE